jgi:hypothetical protein
VSIVGTAIPQRVDREAQCLGPIAVGSGKKVALFSEVVVMVGMRVVLLVMRVWKLLLLLLLLG